MGKIVQFTRHQGNLFAWFDRAAADRELSPQV